MHSFERSSITEVELDAARQYCGQLKVFTDNILSTAWSAIVKWFVQSKRISYHLTSNTNASPIDLYDHIVCDSIFLRLQQDFRDERRRSKKKATTAKTTPTSSSLDPDRETGGTSQLSDSEASQNGHNTSSQTDNQHVLETELNSLNLPVDRTATGILPFYMHAKPASRLNTGIHEQNDVMGTFGDVSEMHNTTPSGHENTEHQERSHSDVTSNASHMMTSTESEKQMDETAVEVIEAPGPFYLGDHVGGRDEHGPTRQELMADESCPGNDAAGMLLDSEDEYRILDISLSQNAYLESPNVPPGHFADNIAETSVDNTTLPVRPDEVDFGPPLEINLTPSDITKFMLPVQADNGTTMGFDSNPFEQANTDFMEFFDQPNLLGFLDNDYTNTNEDDVGSTFPDARLGSSFHTA